jgi:hypothetical protein
MNRAIVIALAAAVAASAAAQPPVAPAPRPAVGEVSLLVVSGIPEKDGGFPRVYRLIRVRFNQGVMQPPETIWEGDSFSLLEAQLHYNRFVVSSGGGVIDVMAKKIINSDQGKRRGYVRGTRVIFQVEHEDAEKGIFAFDLVTHKVEKLSKLDDPDHDWSELHYCDRISPDGRRVVLGYDELTVHEPGRKPRPLGKGFSATGRGPGPLSMAWPLMWLDNARILTQVRNGELVTVTLDGTRTPVVKVPATETKDELRPSLGRDWDGRVLYDCNRKTYVIDVDAKKWARCEWLGLGHGFEIDLLPDDNPREIRYRGTPIGRAWVHGPTTEGYLAVEAEIQAEDGTRIWSASTRQWTDLKMPIYTLIGWMK